MFTATAACAGVRVSDRRLEISNCTTTLRDFHQFLSTRQIGVAGDDKFRTGWQSGKTLLANQSATDNGVIHGENVEAFNR